MPTRYLTIHGHFYQPPRENPWLGLIERQDSAFPQHDWNERIAFQCYYPNARAHILDASGSIETLFNNYIYMSFNFGPTLMSWLAINHPKTYRRILKADHISRELNGGHGNAIAQVYNHMIMPLANAQDKQTQVIWGIEDFRSRFERAPEGMWLAETAVNAETISVLIDHNIKFIILAPTQAQRITPIGSDDWADVSNSSINPRRPYRIFDVEKNGTKRSGRFIDVFFYDGPLSTAVSFEHLLRSAEAFGARIDSAFEGKASEPQLLNIATDGESYGHHEPFGEMGLAYLYYKILKKRKIQPINYAYYLEMYPPQFEVELKPGPNGEGTAWSCAHGVGRWYRDCGCATGGESWWRQEWRTPLRNAFNELRYQLDRIFTQEGPSYFHDVWAARNDYIQILINNSPDNKTAFMQKHCTRIFSPEERERMWSLLEMQRYGMYMFTSCGWFFADISGIEAVQNMCYAKRSIDFARVFTTTDLEDNLLSILASARSNHPYLETGKDVYERYVLPQAYTEDKIVHSIVTAKRFSIDTLYPYYNITTHGQEQISTDGLDLAIGKVECTDCMCEKTQFYFFCNALIEKHKLRNFLIPTDGDTSLLSLKETLPLQDAAALGNLLAEKGYTLKDIPHEVRVDILHSILREQEGSFHKQFEEFYDNNRSFFEAIAESGIELPGVLKAISEYVLTNRFTDAFSNLLLDCDFDKCSQAYLILNEAKKYSLSIDRSQATQIMEDLIIQNLIRLEADCSKENAEKLIDILSFSKSLQFYFENGGKIINRIWRIMNRVGVPLINELKDPVHDYPKYIVVLKLIEIAEKVSFSAIQLKEPLKAFEAKLAGNPRERFT